MGQRWRDGPGKAQGLFRNHRECSVHFGAICNWFQIDRTRRSGVMVHLRKSVAELCTVKLTNVIIAELSKKFEKKIEKNRKKNLKKKSNFF